MPDVEALVEGIRDGRRAAVSQADTERRFLQELSEKFFAGSAAQLALRALQLEMASEEELEAIRRLIEKKSVAN